MTNLVRIPDVRAEQSDILVACIDRLRKVKQLQTPVILAREQFGQIHKDCLVDLAIALYCHQRNNVKRERVPAGYRC